MKPLKLTLTGFRGIQSGMGLETFTLDLSEHDAAQLVAIVAPNGRGKTTILDNLQPYRLMPSKIKNANYSPDAFSYFDHLVSPGKSSKELVWEHDGETYRTLIEWNITAKTQSTSAYLQYMDGDNWVPVTLADGTSSDGKAKTYDRCVEGILGSPRLYFTAAFSAQGRSQLSSYAQGDIKGLMSEVLGLHKIQELGDKAADVVKGLKACLTDRRGRLQELDGIQQQAKALVTAIAEHTRQLEQVHLPAIGKWHDEAARERDAVAEMRKGQQDAEQLRARRRDVQDRMAKAAADHKNAVALIQKDITTGDYAHQQALVRYSTDSRRLEDAIARAETNKMRAQGLLGQRDQIETAVAALPGLREQMISFDAVVEAAKAVVNDAVQAKTSLQQLDSHIATLVDAGKRARATEQDLLARCALTKEVPCQGTDLQGRCKLLTEAVSAESKLPAAQADIAAKTADFHAANDRKVEFAAKAASLPKAQEDLAQAESARRDIARLIADNEKLAAKADGLAEAEAALVDAEDSIRAGTEQMQELKDEQRAAAQLHAERSAELQARIDAAAAANQVVMESLQRELDRIPAPEDDTALNAAIQRLKDAEQAEQNERDAADRLRGMIATAQGRLSALQESIAAGESLSAEIAHLDAEIAHWSLLQRALGRDGILALSIDDAGPTLAGLANDLLMSCYGPRFSVRIDTQETVKSTGVQKETFDVIVFDSESDTSKSVSDMSGGERIWINEALTRAIALYQAQSSGRTFHTLFSDESDGALDPEKKGQFVRMKRRVLELGGYDQEFFISHSPDVWPLADAVINL